MSLTYNSNTRGPRKENYWEFKASLGFVMSPCLNETKQAGKVAQWLRRLAAIAEDLSSILSTLMVAHNSV